MAHDDPDIIARLQKHGRGLADADAMRRARHDDGAGLERRALGQVGDDLGDAEDHVVGAALLHDLAVQHGPELDGGGVRQAPRRHETRPQRREAVEALAEAPLGAVELVLARCHVVGASVAQDVVEGAVDGHVARRLAQNHSHLSLVVGLAVSGLMGDDQGRVGCAEAARRLEEERRVVRKRQIHFPRVIAVVEPDASDCAHLAA